MRNLKECLFITDQIGNPRTHDLKICPNCKGNTRYQEKLAPK